MVETSRNSKRVRSLLTALLALATTVLAAGCGPQPNVTPLAASDADPYQSRRWSSATFTPAHKTFNEAARHFFNIRPEPVQPIEFPHETHTEDIGVTCDYCHSGVATGPVAGIPSTNVCMGCHNDVATDTPRIQMLTEFAKRGEDVPWERVYGFYEEAHVRFNHAPHVRAEVDCAACHGDLTTMTVAQRVVEHTMGFCIDCHRQKQASNDCMVCHY
jgi:hypothetical protein